MAPTILTLRLSREQFVISLGWNTAAAIDIAAAKLQVQLVPVRIVCDRDQHPRFHSNPVHIPALLTHSRKSNCQNSTVFSCRATFAASYACLPKGHVRAGEFGARAILAADLHLLDHSGSWVEDGLATPNDEILDAAEVEPLHEFHETAMRIGKG